MTGEIPLLLRAARGEIVERPPVWMMRQAGRYMKIYRDLREKYPSFRERSENPDLSLEISLQPWRAFQPDGVIMFSDILTPLTGMGIPFDIIESKGPIIDPPIRTAAQIAAVRPLEPEASLPFVKTVLQNLRSEVGNKAGVLGFVGSPWTLKRLSPLSKLFSKTYDRKSAIRQACWALSDRLGPWRLMRSKANPRRTTPTSNAWLSQNLHCCIPC